MGSPLRADPHAVTSPLGTAMVIGIAILLAVGVAIMARVFTDQNEETPPVTFQKDETADSLQVLHSEPGLRFSSFEVRLSVDGDFDVQPPSNGTHALQAATFVNLGGAAGGPSDAPLTEGAMFYFCAAGDAQGNVKVDIRHVESNSLIWRGEFTMLSACPS
jgi:hypothetical protein